MERMTNRERMLAVIQGRDHDRVPFVQYDGLAAPNHDAWEVVGRDNMGVLRWSAVHRFEHPNCQFVAEEFERDGRRAKRTTLHTPEGSLVEERIFEPEYESSSIRKHYVESIEDYEVLMAYLRDVVVVDDRARFLRDQAELGDDGMPMAAVARTPYQQLWIQWVSLLDLSLHRIDRPDVVEECMARLAGIERRIYRVVYDVLKEVPLPFVNVPDNITAPPIGERLFKQHCVPLYDELAEMLDFKKVPVAVHMDGDLKPFWQAIGESRVVALDSFSPAPENDTGVTEALAMWPEKKLLMNFPSSAHLLEPEGVYATARQILEDGGHTGRIWIQISENVPRRIWRRSFPPIVRAIHDFGKP